MKKIVLSLSIATSYLLANVSDDTLFNMSLEELMSIEITTVSQTKERASKSSAVTSVITAKQLELWGVHNVYEALSYVPGVNVNETYMGYTVVSFRGINPGLYNNKALFMINGHPVYERLFGSSHIEYLPLEIIERIEIVRSPASVLYGTNAISGVVNIITKKASKDVKGEIATRGGSFNHYYGSATVQTQHVVMSGSIKRDDGYRVQGQVETNSAGKNQIGIDYFDNLENFFAGAYGETWSVEASYFKLDEQKIGINPQPDLDDSNIQTSYYIDINKNFELGSGQLDLWLRYDNFDKKIGSGGFITGNLEAVNCVERYSAQVQYKDQVNAKLSYIIGTSAELDTSTPYTFDDKTTQNTLFGIYTNDEEFQNYSFYAQGKYSFSDKLEMVLGLRYEYNSDAGSNTPTPRVSLSYEVTQDSYFKLLYSEAFRNPVFLEKYTSFTAGGVAFNGNQALKPEHIRTIELGYETQINAYNSIQATLFYSQEDDEITRVFQNNEQNYINGLGKELYGLEVQYFSILTDQLQLNLNGSYIDGKNKESQNDSSNLHSIANFSMNTILTYQLNDFLTTSLTNQYIGSKSFITNSGDSGNISSYNLVNLNLKYTMDRHTIMLSAKNITDEKYTYPEPVRNETSSIPGGAPRSFYLTYRYKF